MFFNFRFLFSSLFLDMTRFLKFQVCKLLYSYNINVKKVVNKFKWQLFIMVFDECEMIFFTKKQKDNLERWKFSCWIYLYE
jgi:hypothetical protein